MNILVRIVPAIWLKVHTFYVISKLVLDTIVVIARVSVIFKK